jgi:hypothetical protein
MAIATAALINLGIQGAIAGVQYYQGREKQKEADLAAQRAAAKLAGIEEADEVSDLQVPTFGAELARQSLGQQFATSVEAAKSAGATGVLGGIPSLANLGADKALDIAAQLDALEKQRDQFVAQQLQARATRQVAAERQLVGMELTGAQQASAAARMQQQQAGIGFAQGAGETAAAYIKAQPLYELSKDKGTSGDGAAMSGVNAGILSRSTDSTPEFNTPLPPKPLGMGLGIGQGVNSGLGVMEYNDTFDYLNKPVPVRPLGMGPGIGQPITFGE